MARNGKGASGTTFRLSLTVKLCVAMLINPAVPIVVKVGGSLFDWADLGARLCYWMDQQPAELVLIPGGGAIANLVRDWDERFGLGNERSHGLALRAMQLNAELLATLVPNSRVIHHLDECSAWWVLKRVPILDVFAFDSNDYRNMDSLPRDWDVTSDSIAACVALKLGATELVLLKSASPPARDLESLAADGYVDPWFPRIASNLRVHCVNLRDLPST